MAIDPTLMGVLSLGAMKKAERKRAEEATFLTLVPGPAATRAAFSAIAVGTVARDGLRREKKAATAVISAIEAIAAGQSATTAFSGQPALRDLAPDVLAAKFTAVVDRDDDLTSSAAGRADARELRNALSLATAMLIEAIGRTKNLLFTADEAEEYDDFLDLLSRETRARIVKASDAEIDVT